MAGGVTGLVCTCFKCQRRFIIPSDLVDYVRYCPYCGSKLNFKKGEKR